jgi:hypothetical protein
MSVIVPLREIVLRCLVAVDRLARGPRTLIRPVHQDDVGGHESSFLGSPEEPIFSLPPPACKCAAASRFDAAVTSPDLDSRRAELARRGPTALPDLADVEFRWYSENGEDGILGREKGYRLVGVQSLGFNAFFVRAGLGEQLLPERSPRECFERAVGLCGWEPACLQALLAGGPE